MSWSQIVGHAEVLERIRHSAVQGRLATTFLFVGPPGVGKRTFAMKLAQGLLCDQNPPEMLEPCGTCSACQQVAALTHPDLHVVARPADKSWIPVDLLIGEGEHRMREGLCFDMSLKPFCGGRKVAIIDDADYLNPEGANCLLKTLEEPSPGSVIILISTSEQKQLPTIRSRCQILRFRPLATAEVAGLLAELKIVESVEEARKLAELSEGSLEQAYELADPATRAFRERLFAFLAAEIEHPFEFAKELSAFVDAVGKEAPPRRTRLKQTARWATDFFRHLLHRQCGTAGNVDSVLARSLDLAAKQWPVDIERVVACTDRCLSVAVQVDANANQATLIECWLDDLAQIRLGGSLAGR